MNGVVWSQTEIDYLVKHYPAIGGRLCAIHLGRAYPATRKRAELLGIKKLRLLNQDQLNKNKHHQWLKANKDKVRKAHSAYCKTRHKNDIVFRLTSNLRARLRLAIKRNAKSKSTIALLGCSIATLKSHLESKFQSGMSWNNYGDWHIDHIKPCASFDLSNPDEQKMCFHYTNLQPLWARDNIIKRDKVDHLIPSSNFGLDQLIDDPCPVLSA